MQALPDFTYPFYFVLLTIVFFGVIAGRYFAIAGLFQIVFFVWLPHKWKQRRISKAPVDKKQFRKELKWSLITSMLFAFAGAVTAVLWQKGYTRIYTNLYKYGLLYLPFSLILSLLIHETYYYWLHRWMHNPRIFRVIHKVHHNSRITSAWTAFSFHPLEGLLQAVVLPVTILIIPMHIYVLLAQLTIMTFSSVINHLEIEIYPAGFHKHLLGKWLIGATHHSLHHKQFKYNFGLYFTCWDKWKKTESPAFEQLFEEKTISDTETKVNS